MEQFQAVPVLWLNYGEYTFDFRRSNSHTNREEVDLPNAEELVEMVDMSMLLVFITKQFPTKALQIWGLSL